MPAGLEYQITGNVSGLASAASQATGILNNLQTAANNLNIKLFAADNVSDINGIGGALTIVNNKIQEYLRNAIQGSQAFKDQQAQNALDQLANKLQVLTGNAEIFGQSVKNSQQQVNAYQAAISTLLSSGLTPWDSKITELKSKIDALNVSIQAQKDAAKPIPPPIDDRTLGKIEQAEQDVRALGIELRQATSINDIVVLNQRLSVASQNLRDLRGLGSTTAGSLLATGAGARTAGAGINSFNLEIGRVVQDLPFAANNFGAIGNNLTRLPEVFAGYRAQLVATVQAQGQAVNSGNLLRAGITGLFTGLSGLSLALSLAVSAYTFYQQAQQKAERDAKKHKDAVDEQKKALEEYIDTLNASSRAEAGAFSNVQDSIAKLNEEVFAIRNNTGALFDGLSARQAIVRDFPAFTKGYDVAKASVADFTTILEKGTAALEAFGRVQAANDLAKGFQKTQIQNQVAAKSLIDPLVRLETELDKLQKKFRFGDDFDETLGPSLRGIRALKDQITTYNTAAAAAGKQAKAFYDVANQELPNASDGKVAKITKPKEMGVDPFSAIAQALDDIIRKNRELATESGLDGYALVVQKIKDKYTEINAAIDKQAQKLDDLSRRKNLTPKQQEELITLQSNVKIARVGTTDAEEKELADANIKEAERVSNEIQRINNEFGVKQEQSRNRELAGVDKLYDAEVVKARGNVDILKTLDEDRLAAKEAINEKYLVKERQLQDAILNINESLTAELKTGEEARTAKIIAEYDKRRAAAAKNFDELRKLHPEQSGQINQLQQQQNALFDAAKFKAVSVELSKSFASAMQGAVTNFANSFYTAITTLGETRAAIDQKYDTQLAQAKDQSTKDQINKLRELEKATTTSFGAIFSSLTQGFLQTFNKSIFDSFVKSLTENLGTTIIGPDATQLAEANTAALVSQSGVSFAASVTGAASTMAAALTGAGVNFATSISAAASAATVALQAAGMSGTAKSATGSKGMSSGLAAGIAGASIIGGVISGSSKKTNTGAQIAGGALSGAATGAALGSAIGPWGTVVGGVVGGIIGGVSGLFSAKKAKKQEELQKQQLAEQQKANSLLTQQLAFTSSIIGRVTAEGTVTGLTLDPFGKLIATINGSDIQLALDRNAKIRR